MFKLCSHITIGTLVLRGGVNDVTVKRSVKEMMDTARIKLPALGRVIVKDNNQPVSSVETAKLFREGDKVVIKLGYNNDLRQEFTGFVRRVNLSAPVQIECEGYGWQLRRRRLILAWKSVTLRQVLEKLIEGTDIVLSPSIPNVQLTNLSLRNINGLQLLEYFRDKMLLTAYFNFNELYVGLQQGVIKGQVKFRLGWNVIRDDQLKYRLAEDTKVLVRITTGKGKKNKRLLYEAGDQDGSISEFNIPNTLDEGHLKRLAEDALKKAKYTGYEGAINCFLQPYAEPSGTAVIIDKKYNERDGLFFIEGTEVTFGMRGARRRVQIGSQLS